jgi:hypothetical protein
MYNSEDNVVKAVYTYVRTLIDQSAHKFFQGKWVGAESVDANLSSVTIDGLSYRFIRKCSHVTGLSSNDNILLIKGPGTPMTIIGKLVGDITAAVEGG